MDLMRFWFAVAILPSVVILLYKEDLVVSRYIVLYVLA